MDLQLCCPFRATIAEQPCRPPALEIPAAPDAHFFQQGKLEGPIYPTATTPARRAHVPIRMIVERNKNEGLSQAAGPKRREMMEVPGAVKNERGEVAAHIVVEGFDRTRRRRKTERRSPEGCVQRFEGKDAGRPSLIEIEMKRLGQGQNVAPEQTKATTQFFPMHASPA